MTRRFLSRLLCAFSVVPFFVATPVVRAAVNSDPVTSGPVTSSSVNPAPGGTHQVQPSLAKIPLSFEVNRGQTSGQVQWLSRGPDFTLFLAGHDAVLEMNTITPAKTPIDTPTMTGAAIRMDLLGASTNAKSEGLQPLAGRTNYFHGTDRAQWQRDVPTFGQVKLPAVYPGIDLVYYGHNGQLEYDFVVAPGADPSAIRLGFEGANPTLAANGDLLLEIAGKKTTLNRPVVYQKSGASRQPIEGSFAIASNREVTFHLGAYDHSRELTIDPVLLFDGVIGTGDNGDTIAYGMAVDSEGEIILTGATRDTAFPTTPGVIQPTCGPSTNPSYTRCTGVTDAFITKLSADGQSLVFSTYLSGTEYEEAGAAVAVDPAGTIYVVGNTRSDDFPITSDAFQKLCDPTGADVQNGSYTTIVANCHTGANDADDIFLVKINPTGSQILYGTFLGGSMQDVATGVALDPSGNIYISGITTSTSTAYPSHGSSVELPITSTAYQAQGSTVSASLSEFSNDGHSLLYSTFFGSPAADYGDYTFSSALAVGSNGVVFLGGYTYASDLPTTPGVVKTSCASNNEDNRTTCLQHTGFVAAFDASKSGAASLVYSTYIGPPTSATGAFAHTYVNGLFADASNDVFLTGSTQATNFPTTKGAFQTTCAFPAPPGSPACGPAAFLSKLNPTGTAFLLSTYFAGPDPRADTNAGYAIATDAKGRIYLYGAKTGYCDVPVLNPIQANCGGAPRVYVDAFTPDASKLVFGTEFGSQLGNETPILYNGIALDSTGNIYFGGMTSNTNFPTTPDAYSVPTPGGFNRSFFAKISPVRTQTATTLTIAPPSVLPKQAITFTVKVASTPADTPAPGGKVTLSNNSTATPTELGVITLGSNGSGTFSTTSLALGKYSVTAAYSGDENYEVSTSAAAALTVYQASQKITFTQPMTPVTYGAKPVTLAATASSNLAVAFSIVSGPGKLSRDVLTVTGVGTILIAANQTGNIQYMAAPQVERSLVVLPEGKVATPAFTPIQGVYNSAETITIADATRGAIIYYTINGSTPGLSSLKYTAPFKVTATETIKAIAIATGYTESAVASATYTIHLPAAAPVFSVASGTYTAVQTVKITDATQGTTLYYTTNGTTPTASSTKYTTPITVAVTQTIKAIAARTGYPNSPVTSASYTIHLPPAATPTFTPGAGPYNAAQSVTIADATRGATIYYTTNGATPTVNSTKYAAPIAVTKNETILAIAVASGYTNSPAAKAAYTIQ